MILDSIKSDFEKVIKYSQFMSPDCELDAEACLNQWYEAKKRFIDAFDGQLIYELPQTVCFGLGEEERQMRLSCFIDRVMDYYGYDYLADFIHHRRYDFYANKLSADFYSDYDNIVIPAGTKMIRAFKHFIHDPKVLSAIQDEASMLIQEDKVSGKLCFSVHPLDFLSSSENQHKWRSCHALDGEYRAGNLSYMMDSSTVMCYLKTEGDMVQLPHFPEDVLWNNKKWRMWLFYSNDSDCAMAGRQYPFFSKSALDTIHNWVAHFSKWGTAGWRWSPWYNDYITSTPGKRGLDGGEWWSCCDNDLYGKWINLNRTMKRMDYFIKDQSELHYNDLLESTCYTPYYMWCYDLAGEKTSFSIGGKPTCPCCGKDIVTMSDMLVCRDCGAEYCVSDNSDMFVYCAACDTRHHRADMVWVNGYNAFVCADCLNEYTRECTRCGELWAACDLTYNGEDDQRLCPCCVSRERCTRRLPEDDTWMSLPF